jgi:hypothetical protein
MYGGSMIHYMNSRGYVPVSEKPAQTGPIMPPVNPDVNKSARPRTRWEKAFPMFKNVANCRCRKLVEQKVPFQANNIFARVLRTYDTPAYPGQMGLGVLYVVYSYGLHFPMFVFDYAADKWYENTDKYSSTTSKQTGQARPWCRRDGGDNVMSGKTTIALIEMIARAECTGKTDGSK